MLSASRVVLVGESPYPHEQEAIEFAKCELPDADPYHLWALLELLDPSSGRMHEIDILVLGYSALYLVEVKSGPGKYEGDTVDWYRTPREGRKRYMDPPFRLANLKAKVLKSRLETKMQHAPPRVEALVFLSNEDIELGFTHYGDKNVVTRKTFARAIKHHDFPGAPPNWRADRITMPVAQDVARALKDLGIKPRKGKAFAGSFELGQVIAEGAGYQDRVATHGEMKTVRRRARIYSVPQQTSVERRQQLHRAADREFQLLHELREHPNILGVSDYTAAALGPTVLFDDFDGGVPLDTFLRANPELPFGDRVDVIEQVGRALAYCHEKQIIHGALSPAAVLVRRRAESKRLETRLFNFQLAHGAEVEGTSHWSALAEEPWALYQAPELRLDPRRRDPAADIFSLGALAHFVLTGKPPGADLQEVANRLKRDGKLDPRAVSDGIPAEVADMVVFATEQSPINRADNVTAWLDMLVDAATAPPTTAVDEAKHPLEARKGDSLGQGVEVLGLLGSGATSRVLHVRRNDREYALKVSLGPEHDVRLRAEADVIRGLEAAPIAHLVDTLVIGERVCLLLTLAGETLHRYLAREGTVSLDYAGRYGEDLLRALEELEAAPTTHRDIKPANVGVGSVSKGTYRLTLFDFSLSSSPADKTGVGTAAYRDPYLAERGRWDSAADRWSAAITLHEMLTGVRPHFELDGQDALPTDPGAALTVAAERFDPAFRDRLTRFFERALARDLERRFESATDMRHRWIACFEEALRPASQPPAATTEPSPEPPPVAMSDADIAAVAPDTPIAALPLTNRAKNALDRAGLLVAADLLNLPGNRLSAVRGVGSKVAREIFELRERWAAHAKIQAEEPQPFFPRYRGQPLHVLAANVPAESARVLKDAGLHTLQAVANEDTRVMRHLAERDGLDLDGLVVILERENRLAGERAHPSTLEGWLEALHSRSKSRNETIDLLFGLREPFLGRLDVTVKEIAAERGSTTANEYIQLGKARDQWGAHKAMPDLSQLVHGIVERAGGAVRIDTAADELMALLPHEQIDERVMRARAAALVRVVEQIEDEDGLWPLRLDHGLPWICAGEAHANAIRALGKTADELAARPVLASPGETARVLAEAVAGSPLAALAPDKLTELAALASRNAARSPRLELYPRGLPAARALGLCAAVLTGKLEPQAIQQRVRARYPESEPLPDRPELDELVRPFKLEFDAVAGEYKRPDQGPGTTYQTRTGASTTAPTVLPTQPRGIDGDQVREQEFSERLRTVVESGAYRVLAVDIDKAHRAALALGHALGVAPVSFDRELIRHMKQKVKPELLHAADREGPGGRTWANLLRVADAAATALADELLPPTQPLLLIQPGLIARYGLERFLQRLLDASRNDASAAILLLVPSRDRAGSPRINDQLAIPGILPTHAFRVSGTWLKKRSPEAA